jgi:diguanylate cyclase (GGDEF)-like protein/PAS domain S-box-containing protein
MKRDVLEILLIEDNPGDADLIAEMLEERVVFDLIRADRLSSAVSFLDARKISIILLDLSLPDSFGINTFSKVHAHAPHIPIVVLTGTDDEELGLSAVKAGAQDYLIKGRVDSQLLSRTVSYAIERKRFEKALSESEKRLRSVVESVREVIFHIDPQGTFTFLNSAWTKIFGHAVTSCLGRKLQDFVFDEDLPHIQEPFAQLLRGEQESVRFESRFLTQDGRPIWMEVEMAHGLDDRGCVIGTVGTLNDISQRKSNEERLLYMATHDGLTGLPNRSLFEDRLGHAIAQSTRIHRMVAVIFLDLDQFKIVNDSMGHDQGDILLGIVASKLLDSVRTGDTVARLGGDEFAVVLSELETDADAIAVARKIMKSLDQPVCLNGQDLCVAGSIGIAMFPKDGDTTRQLVKNADTAMYHSKEQGRKQICFYSPEMNAKLLERLTMENDMRIAIMRNEFEVYYQPKLDVASGRVLGFEALLRWRHPTRGMVGPEEIIPLAESSGLILSIGSWVLRTACSQLMEWKQLGHDRLTVAVNLSARQMWQEDLVKSIADILTATGMPPESLELEITESSAMRNADETISMLARLNAMGVTLSIDDFGTGYSSLSYLKRFPIHALKVDQSFVRDITEDQDAAAITQGIIALAHTMDLQVIAEGVETESQFDLLRRWNCNAMQGYLFGKPLSGRDALALLKQRTTLH